MRHRGETGRGTKQMCGAHRLAVACLGNHIGMNPVAYRIVRSNQHAATGLETIQ